MMSKLLLARGYGLIVGMIALALGSLAWLDSVRFAQGGRHCAGCDRFRHSDGREVHRQPQRQHRTFDPRLLLSQAAPRLGGSSVGAWAGCLFDAIWLGMALQQGAVNAGTLPTLIGASVLTVLNFVCGFCLAKARDAGH